jgi:hypothetical protein
VDLLTDTLFWTWATCLSIGVGISISSRFASSVRSRATAWAVFVSGVMFLLYLSNVLVWLGVITPAFATSVVAGESWFASLLVLNWLISIGFWLLMTFVSLWATGLRQHDLAAVRWFCQRFWLPIVIVGAILSLIEYILPMLARW